MISRTAELERRLAERGEWQFQNGIASFVAAPDLYKQFKNHGPVLKWPREFNDATIEFQMKATNCRASCSRSMALATFSESRSLMKHRMRPRHVKGSHPNHCLPRRIHGWGTRRPLRAQRLTTSMTKQPEERTTKAIGLALLKRTLVSLTCSKNILRLSLSISSPKG